MKINVVKRKAASNRELSHAVYDIPEVKDLRGLLYQIMLVELSARPELSSAGKIAYELSQERKYTKEQAWDILEQDFSDGLFRVFFNGEEYTNLTDVLDVQEENELVIIRGNKRRYNKKTKRIQPFAPWLYTDGEGIY